jgi:hypothetical protein
MSKETKTYLEAGFKKINNYLQRLFGMKDEKKGFWIFTSHRYSAEQIFSSPEYNQMISTINKIGDDINNWDKNEKLDVSTRHIYNVNRDELLEKIDDLKIQIERREPTWWDKVKTFFKKFIDFIIKVLPKILHGLIAIFSDIKLLNDTFSKIGKLTLPKSKHYIDIK